jgi:hypothetical protein
MKSPCDKCGTPTNLNAFGLCRACRTIKCKVCGNDHVKTKFYAEIKDVCRMCYDIEKRKLRKRIRSGD